MQTFNSLRSALRRSVRSLAAGLAPCRRGRRVLPGKGAIWILVAIIGCSFGADSLEVGEVRRYSATFSIAGLLSSTTEEYELVERVDEPESINGKRYDKVVTIVKGRPGAEPGTAYSRRSGDRVFHLNQDRETEVERLHAKAWSIGYSYKLGGAACTVEAVQDVILETKTYEDAWKTVCTEGRRTARSWTTRDGLHLRTVTELDEGQTIEIRLIEITRVE